MWRVYTQTHAYINTKIFLKSLHNQYFAALKHNKKSPYKQHVNGKLVSLKSHYNLGFNPTIVSNFTYE